MAGLGFAFAGTHSAGFQSVDSAPPTPTPGTGARLLLADGAYAIDSATHDIARDTQARHRVRLALMTESGTATADTSLGIAHPRKMDQTFQSEQAAAVVAATERVTREQLATIDAVSVEAITTKLGNYETQVDFTDLNNAAADKANR